MSHLLHTAILYCCLCPVERQVPHLAPKSRMTWILITLRQPLKPRLFPWALMNEPTIFTNCYYEMNVDSDIIVHYVSSVISFFF